MSVIETSTGRVRFPPDAPEYAKREAATTSLAIADTASDAISDLRHLEGFISGMHRERARVLGFPGNLDFDLSGLTGLLTIFLNNVGDPGSPDSIAMNSKRYEQEVIRFIAALANGDPDASYGYIASSGSEGNLFGMLAGRRMLPDAPVYCSADAHYSVRKAAEVLRMELIEIPTGCDQAIDIDALHEACAARPGAGAIVVATVGTTMQGAIDDVRAARSVAWAAGDVYLHVDAALGGIPAAFAPRRPAWGFDAGADSITISGHKLIGLPVPCAVVTARAAVVKARRAGEYTGAADSTLATSRSGLAAVLLWYRLRATGRRGLARQVRRGFRVAAYAERRLGELGRRPWRDPASLTVVFDRPEPEVCAKWHLATEGDRAHLVAVPHVTAAAVDELCADIARAARGDDLPKSAVPTGVVCDAERPLVA